jgi:hypothetical protein
MKWLISSAIILSRKLCPHLIENHWKQFRRSQWAVELPWIPDFCRRSSNTGKTSFHLARTARLFFQLRTWIDQLRDLHANGSTLFWNNLNESRLIWTILRPRSITLKMVPYILLYANDKK